VLTEADAMFRWKDPHSSLVSVAAGRAIIVYLRRIVIWRCRWFANDMLILWSDAGGPPNNLEAPGMPTKGRPSQGSVSNCS